MDVGETMAVLLWREPMKPARQEGASQLIEKVHGRLVASTPRLAYSNNFRRAIFSQSERVRIDTALIQLTIQQMIGALHEHNMARIFTDTAHRTTLSRPDTSN